MQHTVIGIFSNSGEARKAAEELRSTGFPEQQIDIVASHTDSYSTREGVTRDTNDSPYSVSDESRYNEQSPTAYRDSDSLNEDRIEARKDTREDDDSFGDSIGRFFRNLFDNKEEAEKYATAGRRNCIVSVHTHSNEEAERAAQILDTCGAIDIDERTEGTDQYAQSREGRDSYADRDVSGGTDFETRNELGPEGISDKDITDKSIPVVEEDIHIGKREVERGGVRVRARIVEKPVEENLRLREERIFVERNPVNREATEQDFDSFREGEIELTEKAEVPVVNKEARVVEEVRLNKEVNERDEVIRDSVRKTDVDIENLDEKSTKRGRKKNT